MLTPQSESTPSTRCVCVCVCVCVYVAHVLYTCHVQVNRCECEKLYAIKYLTLKGGANAREGVICMMN